MPLLQAAYALVPQFQALPAECQEQYKQEVEAERRKLQEAEHRKQQAEEARKQKEAAKALRDNQLAEESKRRQEQEAETARLCEIEENRQRKAQKKWDSCVAAAKKLVPEEEAVADRYPALQTLAGLVKFLTVLTIIFLWLGGLGFCVSSGQPGVAVLTIFVVLLASVFLWLVNFAYAELILLAIDVANDSHVSRLLLKGIRYSEPKYWQHNAEEKSSPPPPRPPES